MKNNDTMHRKAYVARFYRGNYPPYIAMLLAAGLFSALNLSVSWLLQQIIDAVSRVPGAMELSTLTELTSAAVLLIVPLKAVTYAAKPSFMKRAMTQFKNFAFQKLMKKSIASFRSEATSVYLSAFSNDLATVETDYLEVQYELVFNIVFALGAIMLMLTYHPALTLVALCFCLLPLAVSSVAGSHFEKAQRAVSEKNAGFVAALKNVLSGFSVVKSFRAEDAAIHQLEQNSAAVESAKAKKRRVAEVLSCIGGIAGISAQLGTFLVGAYWALSGSHITPGVLTVFMDLTAAVINPIRDMPEMLAKRKAALALVDKMASALESNIRDEGEDISRELHDGISIQHLRFGYAADREILHDIDLRFESGKSYAIVGNSGSGKSTLLNLLMASRHDYEGAILFDGTELRGISSRSLYETVSMIEQDVFVFNASIRDNITMFRDFPAEDVDRAIALSGLKELITEHGENYLCGENGAGLSGGEKQRISIARSLLQKTSVLLADEVTSSLDAQTAYQVVSDLPRLRGITRIVVTHTLIESLLKQYDGIIALKEGRVVESGTFDELTKRKGYFYALFTVAQ